MIPPHPPQLHIITHQQTTIWYGTGTMLKPSTPTTSPSQTWENAHPSSIGTCTLTPRNLRPNNSAPPTNSPAHMSTTSHHMWFPPFFYFLFLPQYHNLARVNTQINQNVTHTHTHTYTKFLTLASRLIKKKYDSHNNNKLLIQIYLPSGFSFPLRAMPASHAIAWFVLCAFLQRMSLFSSLVLARTTVSVSRGITKTSFRPIFPLIMQR